MEKPIKEEIIDNATIRLLKHNIIETIIHDYTTWDEPDAYQAKNTNAKLSEGKPYGLLVDSGMFTTITKEARVVSASSEFAELTVAKALFVRTLGHRLVGNIYIKVNKPKIKTKIFDSREEALDWLDKELN